MREYRIILLAALLAHSTMCCGRAEPSVHSAKVPTDLPATTMKPDTMMHANNRRIGDTVTPTVKTYTFSISNRDPKKFGSKINLGPTAGDGPRSIALLGNYVYIFDGVHENVKRIDLNTGSLTVKALDNHSFSDMAGYNGNLYLSTFDRAIFKVDSNLNVLGEIDLGAPYLSGEALFINQPSEALRLLGGEALITLRDDSAHIDSVSSTSQPSYESLYRAANLETSTSDSNTWYVVLWSDRAMRLSHRVPTLEPMWFTRNSVVDSTRLAYYTIDQSKLKLYVYSLPQSSPNENQAGSTTSNKGRGR